MSASTEPEPLPLEIDLLLTEDQRRTVTVDDHAAFRESLAHKQAADEIDELVADIRAAEQNREGIEA